MAVNNRLNRFESELQGIELRPVEEDDMGFLRKLYGSIREEELKLTDWNDDQKRAFIDQQFTAQHRYYIENYNGAQFDIILINGIPAGRLYLVQWEEEIRIIDIAFLPEFRDHGWGSLILRALLDKGRTDHKKIGIHVENFNPAMRLYLRLGFVPTEDKGVYQYMAWIPGNK